MTLKVVINKEKKSSWYDDYDWLTIVKGQMYVCRVKDKWYL